jgi:hypothetical protein
VFAASKNRSEIRAGKVAGVAAFWQSVCRFLGYACRRCAVTLIPNDRRSRASDAARRLCGSRTAYGAEIADAILMTAGRQGTGVRSSLENHAGKTLERVGEGGAETVENQVI